jgi:hypothetical protein
MSATMLAVVGPTTKIVARIPSGMDDESFDAGQKQPATIIDDETADTPDRRQINHGHDCAL